MTVSQSLLQAEKAYVLGTERTYNMEYDEPEHYLIGLIGELGEVISLHKKARVGKKPLDLIKYVDELGDVAWYLWRLNACLQGHSIVRSYSPDLVSRTETLVPWSDDETDLLAMLVGFMGMATKSLGGLIDFGGPYKGYRKRFGIRFYQILRKLNLPYELIWETNLYKLSVRHPQGFSDKPRNRELEDQLIKEHIQAALESR